MFIEMADTSPSIDLPMERPMYNPSVKPKIADVDLTTGDAEIDAGVLFSQVVIDKSELVHHINHSLHGRSQISLHELLVAWPLQNGLAELITYMQLANEWKHSSIDDNITDIVEWEVQGGVVRRARLPRVIFERE
jgi:hypothetical protein